MIDFKPKDEVKQQMVDSLSPVVDAWVQEINTRLDAVEIGTPSPLNVPEADLKAIAQAQPSHGASHTTVVFNLIRERAVAAGWLAGDIVDNTVGSRSLKISLPPVSSL